MILKIELIQASSLTPDTGIRPYVRYRHPALYLIQASILMHYTGIRPYARYRHPSLCLIQASGLCPIQVSGLMSDTGIYPYALYRHPSLCLIQASGLMLYTGIRPYALSSIMSVGPFVGQGDDLYELTLSSTRETIVDTILRMHQHHRHLLPTAR